MMTQKDSICLGFLVQREICVENNILLSQEEEKFFRSYENSSVDKKAKNIAKKIRKMLPRNIKPKNYVSCITGDPNINFYLTYGKTMSVRMSANGWVPPRTLGQAGVKVAKYYYEDILNEKINSRDDLKRIYIQPKNIVKLLPLWIEKLLWCDYNFFVISENDIRLIKKFDGLLELDDSVIKISSSLNYPSISYDGISLIQPAYVRTTPNIRLQVKNINRFLNKYRKVSEKASRWNYGDATERAICEIYKLNKPPKADEELVNRIKPYIERIFNEKNIKVDEYVGKLCTEDKISKKIIEINNDEVLLSLIKGFGNTLNSPMDFYAERKSISVKSTKLRNGLVCPDTIGQPSSDARCKFVIKKIFTSEIPEYKGEITPEIFVDIVFNRENLVKMLQKYLDYLFSCDYLFYMNGNNNNIPICNIYERSKEGMWAKKINWINEEIRYVKSIADVKTALRKNNNKGHGVIPIDYKDYRLGQFDIHKRNNYIYQFRFNIQNLIDLLVSENL